MIEGDEGFSWTWPPLSTVTDIALHHVNLKLICRRCSGVRVLNGAGLMKLFESRGWDQNLQYASRRFRCTRCWIHEHRKVRPRTLLTMENETGEPLPMPDEREWRRITSRYRC
jgi:hypothetical protein